ncbi:SGNH/GDSL hydrolase family protein [Variovorax sp. J22R24]|uniref:SGNH/GDSL hydrolase family protein n=1 Tax=Variovorax gracilis TaxID=3053502 RepID=UPI0025773F2B|nr:SGNH/GDSL hydrolase family protein [Variovorax sp. J22R24]MDM0109037.1 SGNH/GDSL hydrolase family protein [Variovorax sp. J22R24]
MKHSSQKTAISILFAAVLTACGGGGGGEGGADTGSVAAAVSKPATDTKQEGAAAPTKVLGCTVELYGDSIMAGNGTEETPAMTLQRLRPNLQVTADHAVAGTMLTMLAPTFDGAPRTARYVVIENGVIDSWQGIPVPLFLSTYSAMISQLRAEGRVPVLTGFARQAVGGLLSQQDVTERDLYDALLKNYAAEQNVAFADWGAVRFDGPADLMDFVHPDKTYSDRLVEQLATTLDTIAPECAK